MPELRIVVLALQDRLAYGPNYETALAALFGDGPSTLGSAATAPDQDARRAQPPPASANVAAGAGGAAAPPASTSDLIRSAAQDLEDYQRLTAEGRLGEAGQRLESLKQKLEQLQAP
jgi:uncharacterized membrane protein (UPF0182 family)